MWYSLCLYEIQIQYKPLVYYLHTCSEPVWLVSYYLLHGELVWQYQPDQSLSVFARLTIDLQWNCCYFGCTQCISTIYSKGNFQWAGDLRNVPSENGRSLSLLHTTFLSHLKYLVVVLIFSLTILQVYRRPVNLEYTEKYSTVLTSFITEQWRNNFTLTQNDLKSTRKTRQDVKEDPLAKMENDQHFS